MITTSNQNSKVLIVDDDPELLESASDVLSKIYDVKTASSVPIAKTMLSQTEFDVAVVDLNFEGQEEDGIALLDFIGKNTSDVEVVILSRDIVTTRIVEAMKRNLVDFIPKSAEYGTSLKIAIARGLQKKKSRTERLSKHTFLTQSPKMLSLLRYVHKVAESKSPSSILITGETGAGKEILAKYISGVLGLPLVSANMASIPRETAESELFGHTRGAFTGATSNKPGLIEQAHNGLFFLDELGECSLSLQAKLLRVIQEKEIMALGTVKPKKIEVRFMAATNRNLDEMVKLDTFRLDLLQRLNTIRLRIPPLRERPEDIILYANRFLADLCKDRPFVSITPCGVEELLNYQWPGNVRELKSVMERSLFLTERRSINGEIVRIAIANDDSIESPVSNADQVREADSKRAEVIHALASVRGNRTRAAEILGIHPETLRRMLKRHGINSLYIAKLGRPTRFDLSALSPEVQK